MLYSLCSLFSYLGYSQLCHLLCCAGAVAFAVLEAFRILGVIYALRGVGLPLERWGRRRFAYDFQIFIRTSNISQFPSSHVWDVRLRQSQIPDPPEEWSPPRCPISTKADNLQNSRILAVVFVHFLRLICISNVTSARAVSEAKPCFVEKKWKVVCQHAAQHEDSCRPRGIYSPQKCCEI